MSLARQRRSGEIYIIPIRLDSSEIPFEGLKEIQELDLSLESEYEKHLKQLIQVIEST